MFMGVPAIVKMMIIYYEKNGMETQAKEIKQKLKRLRYTSSGSAPLPTDSFKRWKEITGHTLIERFGTTEFNIAIMNSFSDESKRIPGHVGFPLKGVKAALLDPELNEIHEDIER
jgi:malonyl-CoA/methylmalonyl-CoA synthetase